MNVSECMWAVKNSRFPLVPLPLVTEFTTGWTPSSNRSDFYGEDHLWATIADLNGGTIQDTKSGITDLAVQARGNPVKSDVGDLLFSFKLSVGQVAIVNRPMFTNEAIATFKPSEKLYAKFAYYAFPIYLTANANTNIYGAPLLNSELISKSRVPLLPLDTQRRIADYLDKETAQIDSLVAELDGYVELLEKRERTRLDNLLSTYPVSKLGHFWTVTDCLHVTAPFVDEDSGCDNNYVVSIEQLGKREIDLSKANQTTDDAFAELRRGGREPRDGDIIMSRNASVGKCSIVGGEAAGIALGQDVVLMSPQGEQSSQLLYYFLNTSLLQSSISKVSVGSTFKRINVAQIKSLPFPVIPKEGQDHLVTRIEAELTRTDTIITQCEELKELLLKRRQVLITDVVTGKVEV